MDERPLISVVIPTYNEENYIEDLLESIKQQTYQNYEVIAVDSSTDKTANILRKYKARVIKAPKINIAAARNIGIKASNGKVIALIDADYILSKNLFASVIRTFDEDEQGKIVCIEPRPRLNLKDLCRRDIIKFKLLNNLVYVYKKISFFTWIPAAYGCDFCRVDAVKKAGYFNENIDVAEDKEFFSRLRIYGRFKLLKNSVRMSYRRHAKEGTLKTGFIYFSAAVLALFTKKFKFRFKSVRRKKHGKK
ncbi:glycosyltransferase [Candidatus Parvarchaeota archaeon]|jgi:glycosyltransferase involved in cell wall biosynthesis|nr:glycosyltransferase [Candidatus Parvarchaeota archaeon]